MWQEGLLAHRRFARALVIGHLSTKLHTYRQLIVNLAIVYLLPSQLEKLNPRLLSA